MTTLEQDQNQNTANELDTSHLKPHTPYIHMHDPSQAHSPSAKNPATPLERTCTTHPHTHLPCRTTSGFRPPPQKRLNGLSTPEITTSHPPKPPPTHSIQPLTPSCLHLATHYLPPNTPNAQIIHKQTTQIPHN